MHKYITTNTQLGAEQCLTCRFWYFECVVAANGLGHNAGDKGSVASKPDQFDDPFDEQFW